MLHKYTSKPLEPHKLSPLLTYLPGAPDLPNIGVIQGLYRGYVGIMGNILRLYRDNGEKKETIKVWRLTTLRPDPLVA